MINNKTLFAAVAVILFNLSLPAFASPPCKYQKIDDLAKAIAENYDTKRLSGLDSQKPYAGRVRVVIEHSLGEDNAKIVRWFTSLARAEAWLKSREHDQLPARESRPLKQCAKGVCEYDFDGGILHNHLYLQKISYGLRGGCPYIKTIYLLDGD
jgi:hypothetical protein